MPPAAIRASRLALAVSGPAAAIFLVACGGGSGGQHGAASSPAPSSSPTRAHQVRQTTARPPAMAGVTARGALVLLSPVTGAPGRTLVPGGVTGDEISVSPDGRTVYFSTRHGCVEDVESVPVTGGKPTLISTGSLPAISPDGASLAFARQPAPAPHCMPSTGDLSVQYNLVIRTLSTGVEHLYPMLPAGQSSGLPAPISHLSWAPGGHQLAVSIAAIQDNEGWQIVLMDPAVAQSYLAGTGDTSVPVTGPARRRSYWREGVYLPSGQLFVSRACCAGIPVRNTSRLMWEVNPAGVLVHQVAIGFATLDHDSLDASRDGGWLLYLGGGGLYVSRGGAAPSKLTSGLIAAAFV